MVVNGRPAWKPGSHISGVSAEVAAEELSRLEQDGRLTADEVKEAARPDDAPLHPIVFDCAPGEAAERYYSDKAAHVIRCLVVYPEGSDNFEEKYVYVRSEQAYAETRIVVREPDRWNEALAEVIRDFVGAKAHLARLRKIADEVAPEKAERVARAEEAVQLAVDALSPQAAA